MPVYNFMKTFRQDLQPYREITINKELINLVEDIFSKHHSKIKDIRNDDLKPDLIARHAWSLAEKIEDALNISLQGNYFGKKLPHPFIVAPGKHTRPGKKNHLQSLKWRAAEGWSGAVAKTVVGETRDGNCPMLDSRGDVYWPVILNADFFQFISGERGSKLSLNDYISNFLKPALDLADQCEFLIIPSLICSFPVKEHLPEWEHSLQMLFKVAKSTIESDISPTVAMPLSSCHSKNEIISTVTEIQENIKTILELETKKFPNYKIIQKISGQYRDLFPYIVESLKEMIDQDRTLNFTLFNRQLGTLCLPWLPLKIKSAIGVDALFYPNIHVLDELYSSIDNRKKVIISYSGGITDGMRALIVIGVGGARSIQVATALMRNGSAGALYRILGGFSLLFHWFADYLEGEMGIDVSSLDKLAFIFHDPKVQELMSTKLLKNHVSHVACIDPNQCTGKCRVKPPLDNETECPASACCPVRAIKFNKITAKMEVDPRQCIGCGNCGETCILSAVEFKRDS
ncbi:MAG: indolepyruvate ferredoxin oxidoreductase subunit alpha [Promethearchaeota archaeon]